MNYPNAKIPEVREEIKQIRKWISENKTLKDSNIGFFKIQIEKQFKLFAEEYPSLFKLLIEESDLEPIIIKTENLNSDARENINNPIINKKKKEREEKDNINNKNIFDENFSNKLKQAEKELINKLKKDKIKSRNNDQSQDYIRNKNDTDNNNLNFVNTQELVNSKQSQENLNSIPIYKIVSLDTKIKINPEKTYGEVNEKVKFELSNGSFSSIIRKISLGGSSDSLVAFKLTTYDVKLKEARILNNCFEDNLNSNKKESENSFSSRKYIVEDTNNNLSNSNFNSLNSINPVAFNSEAYLCVIAIFDEINAKDKSQFVEIEYEYIAQNILRIKEADLSSRINNKNYNSIVWFYDNFKRMQQIENINLNTSANLCLYASL